MAGATGYKLLRYDRASKLYREIKETTATSYLNTNLPTGTYQFYKVYAYRDKVDGSSSKTMKQKPILGSTKIATRVGLKKIRVIWHKVYGTNKYCIYRATTKNGKYRRIAVVGNTKRTYLNKNLKKGKKYYYKVRAYRAVNSKHIYGDYSNLSYKTVK